MLNNNSRTVNNGISFYECPRRSHSHKQHKQKTKSNSKIDTSSRAGAEEGRGGGGGSVVRVYVRHSTRQREPPVCNTAELASLALDNGRWGGTGNARASAHTSRGVEDEGEVSLSRRYGYQIEKDALARPEG